MHFAAAFFNATSIFVLLLAGKLTDKHISQFQKLKAISVSVVVNEWSEKA